MLEDRIARAIGAESCGELYRINYFFGEGCDAVRDDVQPVACACGQPVWSCEFWREVGRRTGLDLGTAPMRSQLGRWQRALFKVTALFLGPRTTRGLAHFCPPFRRELDAAGNCFKVYESIAEITGTCVVIDSSKQIHQYLMLKTLKPARLRLVVLVRDGRAVAASMTRGRRRETLARQLGTRRRMRAPEDVVLFRAAVRAWFVSTVGALLVLLLTVRTPKVMIRYEEFCSSPIRYTLWIAERLGVHRHMRPLDSTAHSIGGSPSRYTRGFGEIRLDNSWRERFGTMQAKNLSLPARLLQRVLGYPGA